MKECSEKCLKMSDGIFSCTFFQWNLFIQFGSLDSSVHSWRIYVHCSDLSLIVSEWLSVLLQKLTLKNENYFIVEEIHYNTVEN